MTITVHARRPDGSDAGLLTSWTDVQVVERWRDVGRWVLVLPDPAEAALIQRGCGVIVRRGDMTIMSGPFDDRKITQQGASQVTTLSGPDDTILLRKCRARPTPAAAITSQGDYDTRTGAAEDLIVAYVGANLVSRLGRPVTLPVSEGRGRTATVRARFQTLLEIAAQCCVSDPDLGFRLVQQPDRGVGLEVWRGQDLRGGVGEFSDGIGNVVGWEFSEIPPAVTRVVVAGGDQMDARMLREYVDSVAEAEWLMVAEEFVDRRDVGTSDGTAESELAEAGADALVDGSAKVSMRVQIEDVAPGLRYGVDFRVGDLVSVFPGGLDVRDRITEVTLGVTRQDGERVSMWVGRKDDDPDERVERIARDFGARLSSLERRY